MSFSRINPSRINSSSINTSRIFIYSLLLIAAFYVLVPLYVMIITSLKTPDELRVGNLLSLPQALNFDAWLKAWGSACSGVRCEGLQPFFMNSSLVTIPAVLISTLIGALNGYVLTQWKFRGGYGHKQ